MVFVKVRETYDLKTTQNKMTVIGIHTPKPDIIKRNFPGLLMQCRAYRPVSADVRIACASVQPLDPLGVGTAPGDVAPEDVFNPILYKAMSNKGMSQLEARINMMRVGGFGVDIDGSVASIDVDSIIDAADDFPIYYGLLSDAHGWKHANPQAGLEMTNLKPLVYEMVYNVGDLPSGLTENTVASYASPNDDRSVVSVPVERILGKAKEFPFLNCTSYTFALSKETKAASGFAESGFPSDQTPANCEIQVPYLSVMCGCIIVPPSRLHSLYFRMVCEWTLEFSAIRPVGEIVNWLGLASVGNATHYQNYSYESTKKAITGDDKSIMDKDAAMVSSNADITKVM